MIYFIFASMNWNPLAIFVWIFKLLLYPVSLLYGAIMWLRNKLYDSGIYSSIRFSVPVICVGNLSTGGTGKTPHIEYLIRLLQYEYQLATQSRGYKRRSQGFKLAQKNTTAADIGDEPMQFYLKFPELVVSVCEERMTGIPQLLGERPDIDIILLDDAYQHRSVKAGFNILITDYAKPFFEDYILPFGNLRESRKAYKRAQAIIVSKCPDSLSEAEQEIFIRKIKPLPEQKIFFTRIQYGALTDFFSGEKVSLQAHQQVVLVSGIAKPMPMVNYLRSKVKNVHLLRYADHHYYTDNNLEEISQAYQNGLTAAPTVIVTTEKDATRLALKIETLRKWNATILILPIEIVFLKNQAAFDQEIFKYIASEKEEDEEEENFEEIF